MSLTRSSCLASLPKTSRPRRPLDSGYRCGTDMSQSEQAEGSLALMALGDRSAFLPFVRRHERLVTSIVSRFASDPSDREDLAQEIFLELWRQADRFDPDRGSEPAFVATVARRRMIDHVRRTGRRTLAGVAEPIEQLPSSESDPVARLEGRDEYERVRAAMGRLRDDERRVIELSILEGATQSEIATRLAAPVGTIKSLARRGMMRLRSLLGASPSAVDDSGFEERGGR